MNYKLLSVCSLLALASVSSFFGGYVSGLSRSSSNGPACSAVWTGQIPTDLKPAFHARYGNGTNDNGVYTLWLCTNGPTDAVKYCTPIQSTDVPPTLRTWLPSSAGLYSCKDS
jgi:hypothetical protein